jgi:hypothetical protein
LISSDYIKTLGCHGTAKGNGKGRRVSDGTGRNQTIVGCGA